MIVISRGGATLPWGLADASVGGHPIGFPVLPSSSENACSKQIDVGVTSEMTKRTRIGRPLNVSLLKNSPHRS